jgi:hypothetical protein
MAAFSTQINFDEQIGKVPIVYWSTVNIALCKLQPYLQYSTDNRRSLYNSTSTNMK